MTLPRQWSSLSWSHVCLHTLNWNLHTYKVLTLWKVRIKGAVPPCLKYFLHERWEKKTRRMYKLKSYLWLPFNSYSFSNKPIWTKVSMIVSSHVGSHSVKCACAPSIPLIKILRNRECTRLFTAINWSQIEPTPPVW